MAIEFARMTIHSRRNGHSAIAGIAYRTGQRLLDERTGETFDYSHREAVAHSEILLPEGANKKYLDRALLWNAVEAAEDTFNTRRSQAQIAKDLVLALPKELPIEAHKHLIRKFANEHFVSKGVVVDYSIHYDDEKNPHAHLYITTRRLLPEGFDKYKARDLNPTFATNRKDGRGFVSENSWWNKHWRECQNHYFQKRQLDIRVDPNHLYPRRHESRIRGDEPHYIQGENQLKRQATFEETLKNPARILQQINEAHVVFGERDLATVVYQCTDTTDDFEKLMLTIKAHPDLMPLGVGDNGRERFTTRDAFMREVTMGDEANRLKAQRKHGTAYHHIIGAARKYKLNPEQKDALKSICSSDGMNLMMGLAGTGKSSYVLKAANEVWGKAGYRVRGTAVSGIATSSLQQSAKIQSSILYGMRRRLEKGKLKLNAKDIIVMDEAGMTDLNDMATIVHYVKKAGAKLVLVGDTAQLQPVGPGAPFRALAARLGFVELSDIKRQKDAGDRTASKQLARGNISAALNHYDNKGAVHLAKDQEAAIEKLVDDYMATLTNKTINKRLVLAHRNADVDLLNAAIRERLVKQGMIKGNGLTIDTKDKSVMLGKGERLLFCENNHDLGVHNGDFGTITAIRGNRISVKLDKGKTIRFNPRKLILSDKLKPGYSATVHKSQGATVDDVFMYVDGNGWNRFLSYVAMTRHRHNLKLYAHEDKFKDKEVLGINLSHDVLRDSVLDFPLAFGERRGFDPEKLANRFAKRMVGLKHRIEDTFGFATSIERQLLKRQQRDVDVTAAQRKDAVVAATFIDLQQNLAAKWRALGQDMEAGADWSTHPQYAALHQQNLERNRLAATLFNDVKRFEKALTYNRISLKTVERFAKAHARHQEVANYRQGQFKGSKGKHAYRLLKDKQYFHELKRQGIERHVLRIEATHYEVNKRMKTLTESEQKAFMVVVDYFKTRQDIAALYRKEENGGKLNHQKAIYALIDKRNELAYRIASEPTLYKPYFKDSVLGRVSLQDLEKHALAYYTWHTQKQLPKEDNAPKPMQLSRQTYDAQKAPKWEYNKVNDAIIRDAEHFYSQVISDEGRRSGGTVRYGAKGSLSVHLQGTNQGLWYSFETGQGGGPIQFLMDSDIGWRLNYQEAIETAARLMGLSPNDINHMPQPKPKPKEPPAPSQKEQAELNQKIKAARYYFESGTPVEGTLGERYLRETRKITGDLSAFRFHPNIKDVNPIKNKETGKVEWISTYHPGIVVAAKDSHGTIKATQTILLDPNTGNKVDKDKVAVVKRTRAPVKGYAVCIHEGTSNKVIIAEGPETAASLIDAAPKDNVYITLGNIRNAKELHWLAKKHHTKTFHFAADKDDTPNTVKAITDIAQSLKEKHDIECYIALPKLNKDKYDFNDVLKEKGLDEVKQQLKQAEKIEVPEKLLIIEKEKLQKQLTDRLGDTLPIVKDSGVATQSGAVKETATNKEKTPLEILQDDSLGWSKLEGINHSKIKYITEFRARALKRADEALINKSNEENKKSISKLYNWIEESVQDVSSNKLLMENLSEKAPEFATWVTRKTQIEKAPEVNWLDKQYEEEWESIKTINHAKIQRMVRYAQGKTQPSNSNTINQTITGITTELSDNQSLVKKINSAAPKLGKLIQKQIRSHELTKTHDKGRDR